MSSALFPESAVDEVAPDREKENLLQIIVRQQRLAQAGLLTASLTHDVGNFVQLISGAAFLALDSDDPEEWRAGLREVQESCRDLSDLTRAFMNLFRRQEEQREGRFRLSQVLTQVERIVRTYARKMRVDLNITIHGEDEIVGEQRLAVQAVVNLATNAVKACASGSGRVEIEILPHTTETVGIRVSDNGPGIPREVRARLFRPYSAAAGSDDGHGLGLFIVRQTVRQLGGRIRIHTSEEGTTFVLEFPRIAG